MRWPKLTVVTPSLAVDDALTVTNLSLQACASKGSPTIRWVVVLASPGPASANVEQQARCSAIAVHIVATPARGIYPAVNQALQFCSDGPFLILGAGDTLMPQALTVMQDLRPHEVLSGLTHWHDMPVSGHGASWVGRSRSYPSLGLFRSHQGMLFGPSLSHLPYDEEFPVAADLDMKLHLWRRGEMREVDTTLASCLIGGVSDRRPIASELKARSQELRTIFNRHFSRAHAESVTALHAARLLQRSAGFRRRPHPRSDWAQ